MHEYDADAGRYRKVHDLGQDHRRAEYQSAEQARSDVVRVQPLAGEFLTLQRIRQQSARLEWLVEQGIDGNDGRDRRRR